VLYFTNMQTKDLKKFLARIPKWPKDAQDELVRSMAEIETRYSRVYKLDDEERAALKRSADDVKKGRFATAEDTNAVFGRFHRS
jgi:hypothetical protein